MDLRIVERYEDGAWIDISFDELKEGDIFRLFESVGEPVVDDDGCTTWKAASDVYMVSGKDHGLDEDVEVPGIECDPVEV